MHENMASFSVVRGERATAFQKSALLYVFCVSKEDFPIRPIGLPCVNLVCRQVHVSFVNKMSERRISLVPLKNGGCIFQRKQCSFLYELAVTIR